MTKSEFLDILRSSLNGELPIDKVNENINYYDQYITLNISKGKSDDEIFNELGEPRLIAKTIIDTYKISKSYQYKKDSHTTNYENETYDSDNKFNREKESDRYQGNDQNIRFGFGNPMPWYQKLLGIIIIILVIFVVITLGGIAINLFFTIGLPIIFAYFLYKLIISLFHRKY